MLMSCLLGAIIFGYAGWTLFRLIKKSKQGSCAVCNMNKSCPLTCTDECKE